MQRGDGSTSQASGVGMAVGKHGSQRGAARAGLENQPVVEAMHMWWDMVRTDTAEDTSVNLFRTSTTLDDRRRLRFAEQLLAFTPAARANAVASAPPKPPYRSLARTPTAATARGRASTVPAADAAAGPSPSCDGAGRGGMEVEGLHDFVWEHWPSAGASVDGLDTPGSPAVASPSAAGPLGPGAAGGGARLASSLEAASLGRQHRAGPSPLSPREGGCSLSSSLASTPPFETLGPTPRRDQRTCALPEPPTPHLRPEARSVHHPPT